jgi:hypothetical protein
LRRSVTGLQPWEQELDEVSTFSKRKANLGGLSRTIGTIRTPYDSGAVCEMTQKFLSAGGSKLPRDFKLWAPEPVPAGGLKPLPWVFRTSRRRSHWRRNIVTGTSVILGDRSTFHLRQNARRGKTAVVFGFPATCSLPWFSIPNLSALIHISPSRTDRASEKCSRQRRDAPTTVRSTSRKHRTLHHILYVCV